MKKFVILVIIILAGVVIFYSNMSFFNKVISSEVNGFIEDGKGPSSNLKIVREVYWTWGKEMIKDETISDASGRFYLPEIKRTTFLGSIMLHEPVIKISIQILKDDKVIDAFLSYKRDYDKNGEFKGIVEDSRKRKFYLSCNIGSEPTVRSIGSSSSTYRGVCTISPNKAIF